MNTKRVQLVIFSLFIFLILAGCSSNPDIAVDMRSGEWLASSDIGNITLTVNESGTAVTEAVVEYECKVGSLMYLDTVNITGEGEGWPIKGNKFVIDDFMKSDLEMKIQGNFSEDNTQVSGTLIVRGCSGEWKSTTRFPVPLSEIDLESTIGVLGNITEGYDGARISDTPHEGFFDVLNSQNVVFQEIMKNGEYIGGLAIYLFNSLDDRNTAYQSIVEEFGRRREYFTVTIDAIPNVGETGTYTTVEGSTDSGIGFYVSEFASVNCHSLIVISLGDTKNVGTVLDNMTAYANQIYDSLSQLICQ